MRLCGVETENFFDKNQNKIKTSRLKNWRVHGSLRSITIKVSTTWHRKSGHVTRSSPYQFVAFLLHLCDNTLLMRFVAIRFPIWPSPMNPTVVAFVDIMREKFEVTFKIRNAIFIHNLWNFLLKINTRLTAE